MFNRALQVKLVKSPKKVDNDVSDPEKKSVQDYVQLARDASKELVKGVGIVVVAYVAADTLRQVTVNAAPKR